MKKVLIIEDDLSIAELERDYLALGGYEAEICSDGSTGLGLIKSGGFDLVLLDIMLPGMDGLEILRKVREATDIPILLISARKEEGDKIRGLGLGADDYISKPFSPGELVARVNAHILKYERLKERFGGVQKQKVLYARGLELHPDDRRAYANGEEINLTQKEFELLQFLMQNPRKVFDRESLFEKIWGMDSLGDASTVTVHVARIREKIEKDPSDPKYIETVWGAGYRFRHES